jgi:hypothetical protein
MYKYVVFVQYVVNGSHVLVNVLTISPSLLFLVIDNKNNNNNSTFRNDYDNNKLD